VLKGTYNAFDVANSATIRT